MSDTILTYKWRGPFDCSACERQVEGGKLPVVVGYSLFCGEDDCAAVAAGETTEEVSQCLSH